MSRTFTPTATKRTKPTEQCGHDDWSGRRCQRRGWYKVQSRWGTIDLGLCWQHAENRMGRPLTPAEKGE
jgi:hypothetical protein